jgi:hypothetical protein
MTKRTSTRKVSKQAHKQYIEKVERLQKAGLIGKVDKRKHASPEIQKQISKYSGYLSGKESAVEAPDAKTARALRRKFGFKGKGKTVIIPREKGERFTISKKGELSSVRPNPLEKGTRLKKVFGEKTISPPQANERLYYTLPERRRGGTRIRRVTFASFDEMLFFLNNYDINFEDVEDYIEIEKVVIGSSRDKGLREAVNKEHRRKERKSKQRRTDKPKRKKRKSRKGSRRRRR